MRLSKAIRMPLCTSSHRGDEFFGVSRVLELGSRGKALVSDRVS